MSILSFPRLASWLTVSALTLSTLTACNPPKSGDQIADAANGEACAPEIAELEFAILTTESHENLKSNWEPLLAQMSTAVGRPVIGFYATDYAGIVEAMGAGKVQVAWYGGKSYIEAAERSDAEAFGQVLSLDGTKGYHSYLITNKDNAIVDGIDPEAGNGDKYVVEHAADLTLAFNDPNSTSGFLVPSYYVFAQQGVNAETIFDEILYAGSHEATALAVAEDQVDVATNNSFILGRLQETNPEALEKIQIIWTSPIIPNDPLAYRKDLPDCLKESIQTFFFNYDNEAILLSLQWTGFAPARDEDWDIVRELQVAKDILDVQNSIGLSEEDKQAELDELNKKLEALK
ncbi:MAG: phosphonate ABC transporter substrate-binding protein [Spirulina sp. SIO3F2]|nr:phosphonate ABC transporter substrate-binding protein [Spirulina sp. SIO3F2]